MVKRIVARLDFSRGDQPSAMASQQGVAVSTVYQGLNDLLLEGIASLKAQWRGRRAKKLTEKQREGLREWLQAGPPAAGGLLLLGDEARFAQWGALGDSWAPIGRQPLVAPSGKRRAYTVFGLLELVTGRLFYPGLAGRFKAASDSAFRRRVLAQTGQPLFLVQDGAKSPTAQAVGDFVQQPAQRLTVTRLPSDSSDYHPIECLWRTVKRRTTHPVYLAEFHRLVTAVEEA